MINEIAIRDSLRDQLSPKEIVGKVVRRLIDPSLSWEDKRPFWQYLYNSGRVNLLIEAMQLALESKQRIPFDLLIEVCAKANILPDTPVIESVLKGFKKQKAHDDLLAARGFDKWDPRFQSLRKELLEKKVGEIQAQKLHMIEKFHFLSSQRMTKQAAQLLKRLQHLYPDDPEIKGFKADFEMAWARNVLSIHMSTLNAENEAREHTITAPSIVDQEMCRRFLLEGEKIAIENRQFALDLAIAFWFMDEYTRSLEILEWAEPCASTDWMRGELLFASRRFIEALEHLNHLEIKYVNDPETTFGVSYLRAQCLYSLGQQASGLEIMQSIVRVRSKYRSAHAIILRWTEGRAWD